MRKYLVVTALAASGVVGVRNWLNGPPRDEDEAEVWLAAHQHQPRRRQHLTSQLAAATGNDAVPSRGRS